MESLIQLIRLLMQLVYFIITGLGTQDNYLKGVERRLRTTELHIMQMYARIAQQHLRADRNAADMILRTYGGPCTICDCWVVLS